MFRDNTFRDNTLRDHAFRDNTFRDWGSLPEEQQLALSCEALRVAVRTLADQAEDLAGEIDAGTLADRGGAEALRLLANLMREAGEQGLLPVGHA